MVRNKGRKKGRVGGREKRELMNLKSQKVFKEKVKLNDSLFKIRRTAELATITPN